MRGKVKSVVRTEYGVHYDCTSYTERCTNICAELYDGEFVEIDEIDIQSYYGRQRFSDKLISMLNNELHNVWINYYEYDGGYWLDGSISDYI